MAKPLNCSWKSFIVIYELADFDAKAAFSTQNLDFSKNEIP